MPALVIKTNTTTAVIIYVFINQFIFFQYLYRNEAPTNLPSSNELAIIITDRDAPANNLANPNTEKKAAFPATKSADSATINVKKFNLITPLH